MSPDQDEWSLIRQPLSRDGKILNVLTLPNFPALFLNKFTFVIPAFNEELRITPVLEDLAAYISSNSLPWDAIVSVDGDDRTREIVLSFSKKYDFIRMSAQARRQGKGSAIKRAVAEIEADYVVLMDGDNSVSPRTIIEHLNSLKDTDCVIYSRFKLRGNHIPLVRKVISRSFNVLLRTFLAMDLDDTQSGYKAIKTSLLQSVTKKVTFTNTFFDVALLYYLRQIGAKIEELQIEYKHTYGSKFDSLS